MSNELLVRLFYAAQGDITQFRIKARSLLSASIADTASHQDDVAVDRFAQVMKEKMADARGKGRGGWESASPELLSRMLREHVEKGDPRDVANFCMMLWTMSAPIAPSADSRDARYDWMLAMLRADGWTEAAMDKEIAAIAAERCADGKEGK
ncbi:hypothetical protein NOV72_03688 [Caballeronia novacaledonica]|uniref:Uncharacterized protein n=1 Tax=Caballeronia novacaledonica TaxID=1544861 RepID=A0A2U3I8G3_9BURK|nr:hypothetical protein [Caballeronia novacaledonica]SPB16488.1 hypothetical protein NOV72_03688 [Caballeronia novacaledonica]